MYFVVCTVEKLRKYEKQGDQQSKSRHNRILQRNKKKRTHPKISRNIQNSRQKEESDSGSKEKRTIYNVKKVD